MVSISKPIYEFNSKSMTVIDSGYVEQGISATKKTMQKGKRKDSYTPEPNTTTPTHGAHCESSTF